MGSKQLLETQPKDFLFMFEGKAPKTVCVCHNLEWKMEGPSSFYWQHHRPTRMVAIETNSYWDVSLHTATKSILRVMQGNALTAQVNSTLRISLITKHNWILIQSFSHCVWLPPAADTVGWFFCRTQEGLCAGAAGQQKTTLWACADMFYRPLQVHG